MKDEELRRKAAEFYLKPSGILGLHEDWIEGRDDGEEVDQDVLDLYALLRAIAAAERSRCIDAAANAGNVAMNRLFLKASQEQQEAAETMLDVVVAAIRAMGEGA